MSLRRCASLVGLGAVVALGASCAGTARVGSLADRIVFSSDRALPYASEADDFDTRRLDLYVMDADGRHVERLTTNFLTDVFPAVSRDGAHIALTRDIDGFAQVFVMDADGRHVRELTSAHGNSGLPAWSPDGRRIAFATDRNAPDEGDEIYVMNADGGSVRAVTRTLPTVRDAWPSWSPDGKRLVFARESGSGSAIFVVNADGSGLRRLTREPNAVDTQPSWSPDGEQIAYESDLFMLPGQIFAMRNDGSRRRQLTGPTVGASSRPTWSSDGRRIVFMSSRRHHTAVWTMHADGTHQAQLTRDGFNGFPAAG